MQSVVDRNVVIRRVTVMLTIPLSRLISHNFSTHFYLLTPLECSSLIFPLRKAFYHAVMNGTEKLVDSSLNVITHGDALEGKWRGNRRMEWVASTLRTTSEHGVSSITTADAHTSAASRRLNWRPPADLNGLVRFAERRNLVSLRVPSHFNWPLLLLICT